MLIEVKPTFGCYWDVPHHDFNRISRGMKWNVKAKKQAKPRWKKKVPKTKQKQQAKLTIKPKHSSNLVMLPGRIIEYVC